MNREASILLIEDDVGDVRLIQEFLADSGGAFELEHASTLKAGLDRLDLAVVDAVLVDMNLPDSQGLENVTKVRAKARGAAIVVLTGRNEATLAAGAVRSGAEDYIVKGEASGAQIISAIRRAIDSRRAQEIERLRQREELQKDLIANVSHEFRTPIAAIKGAAETLSQGDFDPRKGKPFLDIIVRHVDRLSRLVEDVLQVSTIESQRPPEVSAVPLRPAVDRCLSGLTGIADRERLRLTAEVPSDLAVRADPLMLERILENLCANAIEYNKKGGEVEVTARKTDGEALLTIRDTGIGIPQAELTQIFERFHRTARSRARRVQGTGLGLMIVKRLVTIQRGRIWAESEEGKGSAFHVALPVA